MQALKATTDAGAFTIAYYFSTDTTLDIGIDTPMVPMVAEDYSGLIGPATLPGTQVFLQIGGAFPVGTYYCIVVLDSNDEVDESDETNNTMATNGTIEIIASGSWYSNLYVSGTGHGSVVTGGEVRTTESTIANNAPVATPTACVARMYLSDDQIFGGTDTLLTAVDVAIPVLESGQRYTEFTDYTVPSTPGDYWLLFILDADDVIDEGPGTGENDNVSTMAITIN